MTFYELNENSDVISVIEEYEEAPTIFAPECVIIQGSGRSTLFNEEFESTFPSRLNTRVAPEEFTATIAQINNILETEFSKKSLCCFRYGICGFLFLKCKLWRIAKLNNKAEQSLNKFLESENNRLYNRLGLHWRIKKQVIESDQTEQSVLIIEFIPKLDIYTTD